MTLKEYAIKAGLSYLTATRHFKRGWIEGAYKLPSGTIIVPDDFFDREQERYFAKQNKEY